MFKDHDSLVALSGELQSRYNLAVIKPSEITMYVNWLKAERPTSGGWTDYPEITRRILDKSSRAFGIVSRNEKGGVRGISLASLRANREVWEIPWVYVGPGRERQDLGSGLMYFTMATGYNWNGNCFEWDTNTEVSKGGSPGFHSKVAGSSPDFVKRGYFDASADSNGAIWLKTGLELRPLIRSHVSQFSIATSASQEKIEVALAAHNITPEKRSDVVSANFNPEQGFWVTGTGMYFGFRIDYFQPVDKNVKVGSSKVYKFSLKGTHGERKIREELGREPTNEELAKSFKEWRRTVGDFTNYYIVEVQHRRQIFAKDYNRIVSMTDQTYYAMVYDTLELYNQ